MKCMKYILMILLAVIAGGCIEDNGNYNYIDSEELFSLKISGLPETPSIMVGDTLKLSPVIEGQSTSTGYKYEWYAWEESVSGRPVKRQDLSDQKDLELKVDLEPRNWELYFKVTDTSLGVYECAKIILTVKGCPLSAGWYILEDNGESTNIDYIDLVNNQEYSDVLPGRIPGKARSMVWQPRDYRHNVTDEDGNVTQTITPAYHILTDRTAYTYEGNTLSLLKTFDELFYNAPDVCNPQRIILNGRDLYFINNDKIYVLGGVTQNIGKYGAALPGSYELYPDLLIGSNATKWLFSFDRKSHSFCQVSSLTSTINNISSATINGNNVALSNMPYDVVLAGGNSIPLMYKGQGFFLMKHLDKEEYKLLGEKPDPNTYGAVTYTTFSDVALDSKLLDASILSPSLMYNFFYFATGHTVYSYSFLETNAANREKQVFVCPEDETIAIVRTINEGSKNNVVEKTLIIVTNTKDGHWKLYKFAIRNPAYPEINPTPESVYTGEGNARCFIYR